MSIKIFIITFFLLGTACSGTYFFISKLLPASYSNLINADTEKAAMHLAKQMASFERITIVKMICLIFQRKQVLLFESRIVMVLLYIQTTHQWKRLVFHPTTWLHLMK